MIFVLGILTLLALVGIGLVAATRTDAKRVANDSRDSSMANVADGVVRTVQETLRRDIWGDLLPPNSNAAFDLPLDNDLGMGWADLPPANVLAENNEPFDAPGQADRWLAS
ncbi:MAG: hypothetical protein ACE5F9_12815, partial [Phycisphaerae bacterium]